jgi:hypothetical protein
VVVVLLRFLVEPFLQMVQPVQLLVLDLPPHLVAVVVVVLDLQGFQEQVTLVGIRCLHLSQG